MHKGHIADTFKLPVVVQVSSFSLHAHRACIDIADTFKLPVVVQVSSFKPEPATLQSVLRTSSVMESQFTGTEYYEACSGNPSSP